MSFMINFLIDGRGGVGLAFLLPDLDAQGLIKGILKI